MVPTAVCGQLTVLPEVVPIPLPIQLWRGCVRWCAISHMLKKASQRLPDVTGMKFQLHVEGLQGR